MFKIKPATLPKLQLSIKAYGCTFDTLTRSVSRFVNNFFFYLYSLLRKCRNVMFHLQCLSLRLQSQQGSPDVTSSSTFHQIFQDPLAFPGQPGYMNGRNIYQGSRPGGILTSTWRSKGSTLCCPGIPVFSSYL